MKKRFQATALVGLAVFFWIFTLFATRNGVYAQDNVPLVTLIFSTGTRTPTPVNIGNLVWDDLDHNGHPDAGEPGLPGVNMQFLPTSINMNTSMPTPPGDDPAPTLTSVPGTSQPVMEQLIFLPAILR